jgi:hypothetical protein
MESGREGGSPHPDFIGKGGSLRASLGAAMASWRPALSCRSSPSWAGLATHLEISVFVASQVTKLVLLPLASASLRPRSAGHAPEGSPCRTGLTP